MIGELLKDNLYFGFVDLLKEIRSCTICAQNLEHGVRPILNADSQSKILIIGQAPGRVVHNSGILWGDASGKQLRRWLGVTDEEFYEPKNIALMPMGFCYPGKGASGDLPPRPECAPQWHPPMLMEMKAIKTTLLIGQYAQKRYLGDRLKSTLTQTVKNYQEYLPEYWVLPHPSPRNNIWKAKNPWFEKEVIPKLQETVDNIIGSINE